MRIIAFIEDEEFIRKDLQAPRAVRHQAQTSAQDGKTVPKNYNQNPNPFEWVKTAQEIMARARKPAYALEVHKFKI